MPDTREHANSKTRGRWVLPFTAVLLSALLCTLYLGRSPFVSSVNNRTADALLALAPAHAPTGSVVIVDIDEKSLARYGQWPWPRPLLARLLGSIASGGAACVGLDMILAEPDRTSPSGNGRPVGSYPTPRDRVLARALAAGPYVLGYAFSFDGAHPQRRCRLRPPGIVLVDVPEEAGERAPLFTARGVTCNLPAFADAVKRSGFLNASPDPDGILRRVPTLIRMGELLYPSFPLAVLMQYGNNDQVTVVWREGRGGLDLVIGERSFPVDAHGNLMVRFSHAAAIPRVSAGAVLAGGEAGLFRDKIVLVGSSAAGLAPLYQTPDALRSPAEIHALVLENLLSGERLVRTGKFLHWEVLLALTLSAATLLAVRRMAILTGAALCLALLGGTWVGMALVFRGSGYLFSPLLPTVLVPLNYAVLTIVKSWQALAEKQFQLEQVNHGLEERVAEAVTDLREKDRMLIQQGRQAAMGEMISNIAHQWRQPLNSLGLTVQELRLTYGTPAFNKESLNASVERAMELIRHMSQTIEDFRNYFKPDREKAFFRSEDAVQRTLSLVRPSLASMEIEVEVTGSDDGEIYGYPTEYCQVLLNILLNCRDAFDTSPAGVRRLISIRMGREAGKSVLIIADTAGGIPEEIIDKVFDPYFTTKGPDKGTGIGLYMAKTIIERNMEGKLTVRNGAEGAEFRIEV